MIYNKLWKGYNMKLSKVTITKYVCENCEAYLSLILTEIYGDK